MLNKNVHQKIYTPEPPTSKGLHFTVFPFSVSLFSVLASESSLCDSTFLLLPPPALSSSPPVLPLWFPADSLLSAVLRADISPHDKSWSPQAASPALVLPSKDRGKHGGVGWGRENIWLSPITLSAAERKGRIIKHLFVCRTCLWSSDEI